MAKLYFCILIGCLALATIPNGIFAAQDCPGVAPWRPQCPQYCCLKELDEPYEGQYCCGSCADSFDPAVRDSFACKANYYLHQTWAVILIACGVAFILLVFCTCCCCCCCAPCRSRRRRSRSYSRAKVPPQYDLPPQHAFTTRYGSTGGATSCDRTALLAPSAPPPPPSSSMTSSYSAHYPQMKDQQPPPYQETGLDAPGTSRSGAEQLPPPVYRP